MHIESSTWTELEAVGTDLAVVPVGSTEQHGPHATLGTDTQNARTIADGAVDRYDGTVVVTPAIPVGVAEEHRAFSGTLWVSESTFRSYLEDVVESLCFHGFDRVVFVNGHGGNVAALREVAAGLTRDEPAFVATFTWFDEVGEYTAQMGHGGPLETALLLYSNPEFVRTDRLDAAADGGSDRWGDWQGKTNLAYDTEEFSENGVVGDPREANAELGEELFERATTALVELLDAVADRDIDAE
ncbi:MAG: creatininase family protein [Natronomonas sp.]